MDESDNNPTAMTVSKIINERVTIRAKPRSRREKRGMFEGFMGFEEVGLDLIRRGHAERSILVSVSIEDLLGGVTESSEWQDTPSVVWRGTSSCNI